MKVKDLIKALRKAKRNDIVVIYYNDEELGLCDLPYDFSHVGYTDDDCVELNVVRGDKPL